MAQHLSGTSGTYVNNSSHELNPTPGKFSDHFLLFFIAAIGFIGSVYLFSYCGPEKTDNSISSITSINNSSVFSNDTREYDFSKEVNIEGALEVGQKLSFTLHENNFGANFLLDFGNGIERMINSNTIVNHVYSNSGDFKLQLKALKSNKLQTVCSKTITIRENKKLTLR